jgi:GTPase SAR1 family protein
MICLKPLDDRIIVFGQSCVGKTTFAKELTGHVYHCFDQLFHWHLIETFGLSIETNLAHIHNTCQIHPKFILDGWHLSDKDGLFFPPGTVAYVVYATYDQIISQYRVPVFEHDEHRAMFDKWYKGVDYEKLPGTRYFRNDGEFIETTREGFDQFFLRT